MRAQPVPHELALSAAAELGCKTLYSEDMTHGRDYGGVRVINPLLQTGE